MGGPPYVEGDNGTGPGRARVDAARLWTGGLATAAIGLVSGELECWHLPRWLGARWWSCWPSGCLGGGGRAR